MKTNELNTRFKNYRVYANISQKELYERSGVSILTISKFENGEDIKLSTFLKLMEAMDLNINGDLLIPDVTLRPSYVNTEKIKQRVSSAKKEEAEWVWGEDK